MKDNTYKEMMGQINPEFELLQETKGKMMSLAKTPSKSNFSRLSPLLSLAVCLVIMLSAILSLPLLVSEDSKYNLPGEEDFVENAGNDEFINSPSEGTPDDENGEAAYTSGTQKVSETDELTAPPATVYVKIDDGETIVIRVTEAPPKVTSPVKNVKITKTTKSQGNVKVPEQVKVPQNTRAFGIKQPTLGQTKTSKETASQTKAPQKTKGVSLTNAPSTSEAVNTQKSVTETATTKDTGKNPIPVKIVRSPYLPLMYMEVDEEKGEIRYYNEVEFKSLTIECSLLTDSKTSAYNAYQEYNGAIYALAYNPSNGRLIGAIVTASSEGALVPKNTLLFSQKFDGPASGLHWENVHYYGCDGETSRYCPKC